MKRSTRFLIGFAAAALTYGSLLAVGGSRYAGNRGWHPYQAYENERQYRCDGPRRDNWRGLADRPGQKDAPQSGSSTPNR